ncbi:hypothetical protein [Streptomyces antimicrobicus]|uniref:Uncharacterized protein n=1 Tax=Streptomyces antimicrobicus TaxID=2883108 RepID=A0ABS8B3J0_9ACTN|nr:hypothetical protein [Streptomyces antimicrobicus]MCB5179161.1 hypothetical protein [Streptomyces antimicrobicus]
MSFNQPGPYGGQQPGPYGGQQPGPYGQQPPPPYGQPAPQPGYGYPQQAPPPPPGYPQQPGVPPQPSYGYPAQPGMPPAPPYGMAPQQPKKKTGLVIVAAVVAVAVIGGGAWYLMGDGGGAASEDTKGYKLVMPEAIAEYKKDPKSPTNVTDKAFEGEQKTNAEAMGVKNAHNVAAKYANGTDEKTAKQMNVNGLYGEIADPAKAVDNYFANVGKNKAAEASGFKYELVGSPLEFKPAGFSGATMKCANIKASAKSAAPAGSSAKDFTVPTCAMGDLSTLTSVNVVDPTKLLLGAPSATLDEVAAIAAKVYATTRVKA